jgi:hypothetical protein
MQHIVLSLILADMRYRSRGKGNDRNDDDGKAGGGGDDDDDGRPRRDEDRIDVVGYDHVSEFAPFFEIDAHWEDGDCDGGGGDYDDDSTPPLAGDVRANHARLGRRVFNTHLRWDMLPKGRERRRQSASAGGRAGRGIEGFASRTRINDGRRDNSTMPSCGKFLYVVRDLPDACVSFYHHLSNQGEGTYDRGFEAFARDWMDGAMPFGSPLHHLLSYAEGFAVNRYYDDDDVGCDETASSSSSSSETATTSHEHSTNNVSSNGNSNNSFSSIPPPRQRPLLLISYERMKSNLREEVLRIIEVLGLDHIPVEALDGEILPMFDFRYMREKSTMFQPRSVTWLNGFQFLRMGVVGDGRRLMMETTVRDNNDDDDCCKGVSLMRKFRDWVNDEGYRLRISELVQHGLEMETAERFLAAISSADE